MEIKDILSPTLLGPVSYSAGYVPNGVHCFGLAVDEAGILIAGIFGARPMRMESFRVEIETSVRQGVQLSKDQFVPFRPAGTHNYQFFDYTHKDGLGDLLLVLHRAALLGETLEVIGDEAHFYVFGAVEHNSTAGAEQPADNKQCPDLSLWARRMQDVLALPMLSDWYPSLWDALLEGGWAVPCHNYGGFGSLWEIAISHTEWQMLFLDLVRKGTLPGTGKPKMKSIPNPV